MSGSDTKSATELIQPRLPTLYVACDEDLRLLQKSLAATDIIAIDAERASGFRYGQRAYLIQIAVPKDRIFLVDPTPNYEAELLSSVKALVSSKSWIIHAASQDLPCLRDFGLVAINIIDTELAGRLLGLEKVSLGAMTELFLQYSLAKEHSAVDWSTRPLPTEWLNYAALDVDVLFDLWLAIEKELTKKEKLEIALEEFSHLLDFQPKPEKAERWRSVTGIHELKDQKQLTILKSLWTAREKLAKDKDISPGRLVPDQSLVAAVKASPKSKSELASLRSFAGRASRTYLDLWWEALEQGSLQRQLVDLRAEATGIPNHRNWANKFPEANRRLQWMKLYLKEASEKLSIPVENLISPETVRSLCFNPPPPNKEEVSASLRTRKARQWQIEIAVPFFIQAFNQTELPVLETKVSAPAEA
ncbi:MAG: HRDC domain-containing protein [Rhodoluna sp.]